MMPRFYVAILACAGWLGAASAAQAQSIDEFVRALHRRSEGLSSLSVKWEGTGYWSSKFSAAKVTDVTFPSGGKLLYDAGGRVRLELLAVQWFEQEQKMVPQTDTFSDDGSGVKTLVDGPPYPLLAFGGARKFPYRHVRLIPLRLAYFALHPSFHPALALPMRVPSAMREGITLFARVERKG